jgi:mannose-6-phosphate isomerase-like protein (cupin superfamily)
MLQLEQAPWVIHKDPTQWARYNWPYNPPEWARFLEHLARTSANDTCQLGSWSWMTFTHFDLPVSKYMPKQEGHKITPWIYVALGSNGSLYGPHTDPDDAWYWQCYGSADWQIDGQEFKTNPGDWLWIPKGLHHAPKPAGAMAAVRFGYKEYDANNPYRPTR